ncbi:hypothetical protein LTR10_015658 [Elasticomyces elasticus]|nr:hypothetical protein LTR10_015658 [Elasticomyces elasticus]KAK4975508.1 hypothetical protein LTR42_004719 [Elasticomyces elasticus]
MGSAPESSRLFKPLKLGQHELSNRLAMAPLTRFRADDDHVQLDFVKEYYTQRACVPGTLLITEATFITPQAGGFPNVPGIYNDAQIQAWKKIVDSVHEAGGIIYMQLWALGRAAGEDQKKKEGTGDVVSSSDVPMADNSPAPRPLTEDEIQQYIKDYATAAKNAVEGAGFDGVEIHGANGYLIDQFTQDVCNKRTDSWGGSIENRCKFGIEVSKAVVDAVGADKTGIRLSPWSVFQGMREEDPIPTFSHLTKELKKLKLAYIHLVESRISGNADVESTEKIDPFIDIWGETSPILIAGGFKPDSTHRAVEEEYKDKDIIIVFGRYFISTPDLVYRLQKGIELTEYDRETFYNAKSRKGYTDYPFSEEFEKERQAKFSSTTHQPDALMSGIFGLPAELRNRIWSLAVVDTYENTARIPSPRLPGILRVCKQTRTEEIGFWLFDSHYILRFRDFDFSWMHTTFDPGMFTVMQSAYRLGAFDGRTNYSISDKVGHHGIPHWQNLLKSVKAMHESSHTWPPLKPAQVRGASSEMKVAVAAYHMVKSMESKPWAEVEENLENWHVAIAATDARWA